MVAVTMLSCLDTSGHVKFVKEISSDEIAFELCLFIFSVL